MIRGRLQVTVEPAAEPVSLDEIYAWLRLDPPVSGSPDDIMLRSLIKAGRQYVEKATRRALVAQTILYTVIDQPPYPPQRWPYRGFYGASVDGYGYGDFSGWCGWNRIELFRPPVIYVISVSSLDSNGNPVVMDPSTYRVVTTGQQPAFIETIGNAAWPSSGIAGRGLEILYRSGYEGTGSPPDLTDGVPEDIKTAIKLWVQKVYDPLTPDQIKAYESAIDCILQSYTVYSF